MSYSLWFICTTLLPSYMVYHYATRPPDVAKTPNAIKALLAPPSISKPNLLLSRALPNARLVRAFQLSNTFVDPSPVVHASFVREAHRLMDVATPDGDWTRFRIAVLDVVDQYSPIEGHGLPFAPFIQSVTFVVIMTTVFEVDGRRLDYEAVAFVTKAINDLWLLSKTTSITHTDILSRLAEHLHQWIPASDGNPLNFIIPIYENMWRLVATALARIIGQDQYIQAFADYIDNPTKDQFQRIICESFSVQSIIDETLRLHPPTKRIGRVPTNIPLLSATVSFRDAFQPLGYITRKCAAAYTRTADIESLHRSAAWSNEGTRDPDAFDPTHFTMPLKDEQKQAYMPFGCGKLKCVAAKWAPRAASLIVAAILQKMQSSENGINITKGKSIGDRKGWEDWVVTSTTRNETSEG